MDCRSVAEIHNGNHANIILCPWDNATQEKGARALPKMLKVELSIVGCAIFEIL